MPIKLHHGRKESDVGGVAQSSEMVSTCWDTGHCFANHRSKTYLWSDVLVNTKYRLGVKFLKNLSRDGPVKSTETRQG